MKIIKTASYSMEQYIEWGERMKDELSADELRTQGNPTREMQIAAAKRLIKYPVGEVPEDEPYDIGSSIKFLLNALDMVWERDWENQQEQSAEYQHQPKTPYDEWNSSKNI